MCWIMILPLVCGRLSVSVSDRKNRMMGPYKVTYSKNGREMPPARNIATLGAAQAHAARLVELGYRVNSISLDTCG